jgi:hypothetical protein
MKLAEKVEQEPGFFSGKEIERLEDDSEKAVVVKTMICVGTACMKEERFFASENKKISGLEEYVLIGR